MDIVWGGIIGPDPSGCEVTLVDNGTDWGARINAADVALGSKAGAICCQGGGNIASQIFLNAGGSSLRTLRFGPGTWTNSVPQLVIDDGAVTIQPYDNVLIEGHGWDTILQEAPGDLDLSYFLIRPVNAAGQRSNISVRNIQLSGVGINKLPNVTTATMNTGLLRGGTYENIWFNKTHAIGFTIGESSSPPDGSGPKCDGLVVRGCKFTNVGGGIPPDYQGGGGVTLAIINANHLLIDNCQFIDGLGNTVIDFEPNQLHDPISNITISNCLISQELTTGNCELFVYAMAIHTQGAGADVGPIELIGNTFRGAYGQDDGSAGEVYPTGHLFAAVYVNYTSTAGQSYLVTAENNTIFACSSFPFIADSANDNVFKNNTCTLIGDDVLVLGFRNVISGNYLAAVSSQGAQFHGIQERIGVGGSDNNSFLNNTVTKATVVVGTNSVVSGETVISRPSFTPVYTPATSGNVTTTNANDLLIAVAMGWFSGPPVQIQSPFTALQTTNQPRNNFSPAYRLVTSTGTYGATWTIPQTEQWLAAMLALKGTATLVQQIDAGQMVPGSPGLVASTTGGTLATGTYYYRIAGIYHGGEFLSATENSVAVTGPTGSVAVSWGVIGPGFPSYKIYRGTSPGVYTVYYTSAVTSFTDTGAAGTAGSPPAALAYTATLGATPTNGNAVVVTSCMRPSTRTGTDLSSVSVGGVALTKGPAVTTPWGIMAIWHKENVQGATNGVATATFAGNFVGNQDEVWFNASEWSGVLTTNAVDAQITNSFPTTW